MPEQLFEIKKQIENELNIQLGLVIRGNSYFLVYRTLDKKELNNVMNYLIDKGYSYSLDYYPVYKNDEKGNIIAEEKEYVLEFKVL